MTCDQARAELSNPFVAFDARSDELSEHLRSCATCLWSSESFQADYRGFDEFATWRAVNHAEPEHFTTDQRHELGWYETYAEAQAATHRLGPISLVDYHNHACCLDPKLPFHPDVVYAQDWNAQSWTKWFEFDRTDAASMDLRFTAAFIRQRGWYRTWESASEACRRLGIAARQAYTQGNPRYVDDPRLPSDPDLVYSRVWAEHGGWPGFLGRPA